MPLARLSTERINFTVNLLVRPASCRWRGSRLVTTFNININRHNGALFGFPRQRCFSSGAREGFQSIGSFHNENLAEILDCDESSYEAPPLPFAQCSAMASQISDEAGEGQRSRDFSLNLHEWTFLNHGAFGASLRVGQERAAAWRSYLEEQPLRYHDRALLPHLAHSARLLVNLLLGTNSREVCPTSSFALLPNVTSGMNAVLSNYVQTYGKESHVIFWDTTYGSVKSMARHYGRHGLTTEVPLVAQYLCNNHSTAVSDSSALSILSLALSEHVSRSTTTTMNGAPPLLILDHTTSNTALTFPVAPITRWARDNLHPDTLVVVDGAHGLWAQDTANAIFPHGSHQNHDNHGSDQNAMNQSIINVYLANGHKWLAAPRGVGLVWSRDDETTRQLLQFPIVLSHGMHAPDLLSRFIWDGCRDYNAALAMPSVIEYWEKPASNGVPRWCTERQLVRDRLWDGLALLANKWHGLPDSASILKAEGFSRGLLLAPYHEWLDAPMALLRLPSHWEGAHNTSADAKRIQDYLYEQNVEVPIKCVEGKLYVRVSCHIYNQHRDFERLGNVLKE